MPSGFESDLRITHVIMDAIDEERDSVVKYLLKMADHTEATRATAHPPITLRWVADEIRRGAHVETPDA